MDKSDSLDVEIGRRALLRAATVLAVAPVIACNDDSGSNGERMDDSTKDKATSMNDVATLDVEPSRQMFWTTEIATGKVMGVVQADVKQFKGIPYGASTAGANRYMPPKKPASWTGVRECFAHGPISPQSLTSLTSEYGRLINWDQHPGGMGEDCLTLNVWTPTLDRGAKKAVMVSFHGGGFASGSGNQLGFDGAMMAHNHDVVVVTV